MDPQSLQMYLEAMGDDPDLQQFVAPTSGGSQRATAGLHEPAQDVPRAAPPAASYKPKGPAAKALKAQVKKFVAPPALPQPVNWSAVLAVPGQPVARAAPLVSPFPRG